MIKIMIPKNDMEFYSRNKRKTKQKENFDRECTFTSFFRIHFLSVSFIFRFIRRKRPNINAHAQLFTFVKTEENKFSVFLPS